MLLTLLILAPGLVPLLDAAKPDCGYVFPGPHLETFILQRKEDVGSCQIHRLTSPQWKITLEGPADNSRELSVGERTLVTYVTREFKEIVALDAKTGKRLWSHKFPESTTAAATISGSKVALLRSKAITLFDERTGRVLWNHPLNEEPGVPYGQPTIAEGKVLFNRGPSEARPRFSLSLQCLDLHTGKTLWTRDNGYPQMSDDEGFNLDTISSVAVARSRGYVFRFPYNHEGSNGHLEQVVCFDLKNGHTLWSRPTACTNFMPGPQTDGKVVLAPGIGTQTLLDARTGKNLYAMKDWHGALLDGKLSCISDIDGVAYFLTRSPSTGKIVTKTQLTRNESMVWDMTVVGGKPYVWTSFYKPTARLQTFTVRK